MQAAILAIQPKAPPLSFAVWLGGAGLSVCGLFIVQYFPLKALNMTSQDLSTLLLDDHLINNTILAGIVASPVIITLWSSVLFVIGIIDYIIETNMGNVKYTIIGILPVVIGIATAVVVLTIGENLSHRVEVIRVAVRAIARFWIGLS